MQQHNCTIYCPPNCPFVPQYCIPECEDGQNCVEILVSDCIMYEGTYLEQYGVEPGTSLTGVIIHLANLVYPDCTTTTTTLPPCSEYELTHTGLTGSAVFVYTPCGDSQEVTVSVTEQDTITICADNDYPVTLTSEEGSIISLQTICSPGI